MNERQFEVKVHEWLIYEKSYPKNELQLEAIIGSKEEGKIYHADIAVLDSKRSEIISVIEVRSARNHKPLREAVSQLLHYRRVLEKPHIPIYMFLPPIENSKKDFEIVQILPDGDTKEVFPSEFPSYDALVAGDKAGRKAAHKKHIKSAIDAFQVTCIMLAILASVVLFLDILEILQLTSKQLLLGSVVIGLLLLPFAAKFKMLGVEFERYIPDKEEHEKPYQ